MAKFLIEVPHDAEIVACAKAVKIFLETGSHYLVNADWGCMDGVHSSWMTVDADDKNQARNIVPPGYRTEAVITLLGKFTLDEVNGIIKNHANPAAKSLK